MLALRTGPARYRVFAERFADQAVVSGPEDLDALAADFARRLERYCLMAPYSCTPGNPNTTRTPSRCSCLASASPPVIFGMAVSYECFRSSRRPI